MRNNRFKYNTLPLIVMALFSGGQSVLAETEMETLPIEEKGSFEVVNVRELGKEAHRYNFSLTDSEQYRTALLSGNDTLVEFTEQSPFAVVQGKLVALNTAKTKEGIVLPQWSEGVIIEEGQVYAPASFISDLFDLTIRNNELVYEKEVIIVVEEPKSEEVIMDDPLPVVTVREVDSTPVPEPPKEIAKETVKETVKEPEKVTEEVKKEEVSVTPAPDSKKEKEKEKVVEEVKEDVPSEKEDSTLDDWLSFVTDSHTLGEPIQVALKEKTLELFIDRTLEDAENWTLIAHNWLKQNAYAFTFKESDEHNRFIIEKPL